VDLSDLAEIIAQDPEVGWNVFITEVEAALRNMMADRDGGGAVDGAKEYYIGLCTLAEYGKAINTKQIAIVRLQTKLLEIAEQIHANRTAVARWAKLKTDAASAVERKRVAQAILNEGLLNRKRSLLVLAEGYRAAYAYATLDEVSFSLKLSMDHSALVQAFSTVKTSMNSFFTPPRLSQPTEIPLMVLPVIRAGSPLPSSPHAVLHTRADGPAQITWSIPLLDPFWNRWLPPGSRSAYFVTEARFYLQGVDATAPGEFIMLRVGTMGFYENGHGTGAEGVRRFSTQNYALNFHYDPALGETAPPTSRWLTTGRTNDNYMQPALFTSWLAEVVRSGPLTGLTHIRIKMTLDRQDAF
jgi:hypothetical protein